MPSLALPRNRAVLLRRPFSPLDLSPVLWLDAQLSTKWQDSARTTPATADDAPVGAWDDLSGNGNHALQATAGARPLLKLAIQNGLPVLRFDGSNDAFTLGANVATLAITGDLTLLAVAKKTAATAYGPLVLYRAANATKVAYELRYENGADPPAVSFSHADDTASERFDSTATAADNAFHVLTARRNGTNIGLAVNGSALSSATATRTPTIDAAGTGRVGDRQEGSALYLTGDLIGVVVCPTALASGNRSNLERYYGTRAGIAVA